MLRSGDSVFAFGPVVKELEEIELGFESITWIGYDHPERLGDGSLKKVPANFNCILLKSSGGTTILDKIKILGNLPMVIINIFKLISSHDVFYTRGPSVPAFIGIIFSFIFRSKIWWHKYAGSWVEDSMPIFYEIQKNMLSKATNSKVTINGNWPNLGKHILSFENPCIHSHDIISLNSLSMRDKRHKYNLLYVGSLNRLKGVDVFIEALLMIGSNLFNKITFIGGGVKLEEYIKRTVMMPNVEFTGYLNREEIFNYFKQTDFIVLPSYSEGFPKVLAEAAAFGVIPICTSVSSIPQYITPECGYLISKPDVSELSEVLLKIISEPAEVLNNKAINCIKMSNLFTYERFVARIENEIIY
jgi:glycosyltransferase involved in cell wall biosynthesis